MWVGMQVMDRTSPCKHHPGTDHTRNAKAQLQATVPHWSLLPPCPSAPSLFPSCRLCPLTPSPAPSATKLPLTPLPPAPLPGPSLGHAWARLMVGLRQLKQAVAVLHHGAPLALQDGGEAGHEGGPEGDRHLTRPGGGGGQGQRGRRGEGREAGKGGGGSR